jgi:CheY-like chemotaxis protein
VNELTNTILIVDDNEDDVFALRRALKKANIANPQKIVTNGQAAIDYLSGAGQYSDRNQCPLPFLVFLDLKTPFRNGFEVLAWVREQPELSQLAVVILTGSVEEKDHQRADSLGARSFLLKPPTLSDLQTLMQSTQGRWSVTGAPVGPQKTQP